MSDSPGEILFLRVPPLGLAKPVGDAGLMSVFASNGFQGRVGERSITCFWIGMGRHVRVPGPKLVARIREGAITEIVDIGCAGALDPSLRRGDLVLSSRDTCFDGSVELVVHRPPELHSLVHEVAVGRGVTLRRAPILTHERFVAGRDERIGLFDRTGCVAVQMEHLWFLQLLQKLVSPRSLATMRVTHLVLITDAVPPNTRRLVAARSGWDALVGYALPIGKEGIMALRREVLNRWLNF